MSHRQLNETRRQMWTLFDSNQIYNDVQPQFSFRVINNLDYQRRVALAPKRAFVDFEHSKAPT